ncbi:hypothetical protein IDJ81_03990 [Tsuneonella flava]|uniref:Uncharacterized protein n=1 Tax=Tsuneonella flava TaxID=2055955 RepID=A0ABX7KAL4_9SPHN|nr:hypothetical protein [Tsuneonella flava]QSB45300.1 hypothetical protein IDJ81_03990 [Tsuneonella flava]
MIKTIPFRRRAIGTAVALAILPFSGGISAPLAAAEPVSSTASRLTYADLADLADAANAVVHVKVTSQATVSPERAPNVAPGMVRIYVEAATVALVSGSAPVGESLRYLVDLPLDSRGKAPKLKKQDFLLFARAVPGKPGELQLVGSGAQQPWTPELEQRVRPILTAMLSPDAPPHITGVRDALAVPGTLAGESETQMFLSTRSGDPVSISVVRRPGMDPVWGVSFSEIVDQAARPPARDSLEWYRLACFLPAQLPAKANLSRDSASRALAEDDYAYVMQQLGPCTRTLSRQ